MSKTVRKRSDKRMISIRWIVSAAVVGLTSAIIVTVGGLVERNARETLTRSLQERALLEARNLALTSSDALLSDYPELTLAPILSKMLDRPETLTSATVVDMDGTIRGHADPRLIGTPFALPPGLREVALDDEPGTALRILIDDATLIASSGIVGHGDEPVGRTYVSMNRSSIDESIAAARRDQLLPFGVLLIVAIAASIVLVSVLLRPIGALREGLARIGRGDLETPVAVRDRTELGLLATTINEMAARIQIAQQEHVEKERLSREVELAREIQSSLLPTETIQVSGWEFVGAHRPAAEVGGDFYDVFTLPNGRVGMVIADVSGKGLAGCLVASMIVALFRAFRETETSPSALLVRLNDSLVPSLRRGTFVTVFYGILDPPTGEFVFASAAHSPLLVHRAATGQAEWFEPEAVPIGALRGNTFRNTIVDQRIVLGPEDVMVQYTDGVNEAFDIHGKDQFGFERLANAVKQAAQGGCAEVIDTIRQRVAAWSGDQPSFDDETMIAIRRTSTTECHRTARASSASRISSEELMRRARQRGRCLTLPIDLGGLAAIEEWLGDVLPTSCSAENMTRLHTALYEAAANIVEHGYAGRSEGTLELWWLSDPRGSALEDGFFLFRDEGTPFRPDPDERIDFEQMDARRKGRGLGLEIVRTAMRDVRYCPATSDGNVTVMVFDPQKVQRERVTHG